jgi:hypothetical protein
VTGRGVHVKPGCCKSVTFLAAFAMPSHDPQTSLGKTGKASARGCKAARALPALRQSEDRAEGLPEKETGDSAPLSLPRLRPALHARPARGPRQDLSDRRNPRRLDDV